MKPWQENDVSRRPSSMNAPQSIGVRAATESCAKLEALFTEEDFPKDRREAVLGTTTGILFVLATCAARDLTEGFWTAKAVQIVATSFAQALAADVADEIARRETARKPT